MQHSRLVRRNGIPLLVYDELDAHLDELIDDPATPFKSSLFDRATVELSARRLTIAESTTLHTIIQKLSDVLQTTPYEPSLPAALTTVLIKPLPFESVLALADEESIITALQSEYAAANILAMQIIGKAAEGQATINLDTVAEMRDVVREFVRRWLLSPDVQVSETAQRELTLLLEKDVSVPVDTQPLPIDSRNGLSWQPQGKLWRRVFEGDLLRLIVSICEGHDPATNSDVPARQLSLAQDRVLRFLPALAVHNFRAMLPPLSSMDSGVVIEKRSLLHFAALDMIDKGDLPLYMAWHEFFRELIIRAWRGQGGQLRHDSLYVQLIREATRRDHAIVDVVRRLKEEVAGDKEEDVEDFTNYIEGLLRG
jgi:hypothetical protein